MPEEQGQSPIRLRVQLAAAPEKAFWALSTAAGRASFWADSAEEEDGVVHFRFSNGMSLQSKILAHQAPHQFSLEYFGGSRVDFLLDDDGDDGTLLTVVETGVPEAWYADQRAGWVTVLLTLKAALDFGVDLRNSNPDLNWENGFVDV
jgi:uncharacterized protein YndB with AHSA1/START domain